MKTKVIYVHGIKLNRHDRYANKLISAFGSDYTHFKLNWGATVGMFFDQYFKVNYKKPKGLHFIQKKTYAIRRLFWEVVGDVLIYFTKRDIIIEQLHDEIKGQENVILVGHSMGCVIIDEMLTAYKPKNIRKVVTLGNPLAIFRLANLRPMNKEWYIWDNHYEKNDWIACLLNKVAGYEHVNDIEFKAKGIRSFSILAHTTYWRDEKLHKRIVQRIKDGY